MSKGNKYRAVIAYKPIGEKSKTHFDAFKDIEGESFEIARQKLF